MLIRSKKMEMDIYGRSKVNIIVFDRVPKLWNSLLYHIIPLLLSYIKALTDKYRILVSFSTQFSCQLEACETLLISTLDDDMIAAAEIHSLAWHHITTTTDGGGTTAEEARVFLVRDRSVLPMLVIGQRNRARKGHVLVLEYSYWFEETCA